MDAKGYSPSWSRFDSAAISASIVVATALRFWHLGSPAQPVYDETKVLRQAHSFLHGWRPPYSSHPPGGKLLVALGVSLFGNYPWGWRAANALMGTALVPITYLLARRLFRSRLAASIAAVLLLCEGMFLVASRLAMINIVYVTLGAWAYLMLWCFVQNPVPRTQRVQLAAMSILLGLFVSAKAAISEVGVSLTLLVTAVTLISDGQTRVPAESPKLIARRVIGACGLVVGTVLLVYLAVFLAYYRVTWRGIGDFVAYHQHVIDRNLNLPIGFPNASPFWSWPLLLHPYAYWKKDLLNGAVEVIWCGGNPLLWWAVLPAILIALVRGYTQKSMPWMFLAVGYLANLAMWIPIRRYLFIYSYMPALYFGLLALAGALEECRNGSARRWEHLVLLAPILPCLILGLGVVWGGFAAGSISIVYLLLWRGPEGYDGKFVCLIFISAAILLFAYFSPLWMGIPLSQAGYTARMWLHGQGLASWIGYDADR
ncbi:MAG: phospholipid carrier-dependent glycosyltransferase [Rhizomicrobium sp.]